MADRLASLYPAHLQSLKERHDRALAETGFDHAVIFAGAQHMIFLDDMPYPFKANPHFKAWLPVVDNPYCFVVYTPGNKPRLVFYQPVDYWNKVADTPAGYWVEHFDIRTIGSAEDARQHFPAGGRAAFIGEWSSEYPGEPNPQPLLDRLHYARTWKTDYEIECMRQANELGARGHRAAEKAFRAGASEYEIHLEYLRAADHTEEELPYGNIIALNENASVLHYMKHDRRRLDGNLFSFLIDAGASVNGYAADITRTYSRRDDEFARLIQAVDAMQQEICAAVKPRVNYPDLHVLAHHKIGDILIRFDFVRGIDADGIVQKHISSAFFPHGLGHYIGLQVHDVAGFMADAGGHTIPKPEGHPFLRITRPVEPKMVFTIEPGLYFIDPLLSELRKGENTKYVNWTKVDAFRKFGGIRIEDDVVVTERGIVNLTREAFGKV